MKIRITELQYKKLTEGEDNDFDSFLTKRFPNIGNLRMNRANYNFSGPVRRYVNPDNDELYFRVVIRTQPTWNSGAGLVNTDEFIRLYVSTKVYTYVKKYGMNFEYDLIDWFNKTYDENVNTVLKGSPKET
jgi:hypothetical protein